MFLNGEEVMTTDLIDNDTDTCVQLPGYEGCRTDKVKNSGLTFHFHSCRILIEIVL